MNTLKLPRIFPNKVSDQATQTRLRWVYSVIVLSLIIRLIWLGMGSLLVEEAYYWNYAQHMDFGYLDHPPMVAILIKLSTWLFGLNEFGVRASTLLCFAIAAFYSYRLTELVSGKGIYAVFLLSILPFYFIQSWVITPDLPLIACWSCALYCLYRACVLEERTYWYRAGFVIGVGLLSKYTIILLVPAVGMYLILTPKARYWFLKKEPYLALLIMLFCFLPVLYWNATHNWVSFAFQSTRRIQEAYHFSTHYILGLLILFLLPTGIFSALPLFQKTSKAIWSSDIRRFFHLCFGVPLSVFVLFSLTHSVKFNWIGPLLLALVPWLSIQFETYKQHWWFTAYVMLTIYASMLFVVTQGQPEAIHRVLLPKFIDWQLFTQDINQIAQKFESESQEAPVIVALDKYNLASELTFYQKKLAKNQTILKQYAVEGSHWFGGESLMYRYWSKPNQVAGKNLLLVTDNPALFNNPEINNKTVALSEIQPISVVSQGQHQKMRSYYIKMVHFK